jgi:hypothetical protein
LLLVAGQDYFLHSEAQAASAVVVAAGALAALAGEKDRDARVASVHAGLREAQRHQTRFAAVGAAMVQTVARAAAATAAAAAPAVVAVVAAEPLLLPQAASVQAQRVERL